MAIGRPGSRRGSGCFVHVDHGAEPRALLAGHRGLDGRAAARDAGRRGHLGGRVARAGRRCREHGGEPDASAVDVGLRRDRRRPALGSGDPYWAIPSSPEQDCWDPPPRRYAGADDVEPARAGPVQRLLAICSAPTARTPAPTGNGSVADTPLRARLPDPPGVRRPPGPRPLRLVSERRRTAIPSPSRPHNRVVVGPDPSNAPLLRFVRCCFHHQATFKVRTGGEWLAVGSVDWASCTTCRPIRRPTGAFCPATRATRSRTRARSTSPGARSDRQSCSCRPRRHRRRGSTQQRAGDAKPDVLVRHVERLRAAGRQRPHRDRARPRLEVLDRVAASRR